MDQEKLLQQSRHLKERIKDLLHQSENATGLSRETSDLLHDLKVYHEELEAENTTLQQKNQELALFSSPYRKFYEDAPAAYFILSGDGTIVQGNRLAVTILGEKQDRLQGRKLSEFIAPGWEGSFWEAVNKSIETQEKQQFQLKLKSVHNDEYWGRFDMIAEQNEYDDSFHLRVVLVDITERKNLEQMLRVNESMVSSGLELISVIDQNYTYELANQSYELYWGIPSEEVPGQKVPDIVGRRLFEEAVKPNFDQCLYQGRPVQYNKWITSPIFGDRYMDVNYYPRRDEKAQVNGIVCIGRDITEKKLADDALSEAESRFSALVSCYPGAVFQFTLLGDDSVQIRFVNEKATELFNRSTQELAECFNLFPDIHPDDVHTFRTSLKSAARNQEKWVHEFRIVPNGVDTKYVRSFFTSRKLEDGSISFTGILMDITRQRLQERELKAQREKYRNLFESIRDAIVVFGNDRVIKDCNPAFKKLFGYPAHGILKRKASILCENRGEYQKLENIIRNRHAKNPFLKTIRYRTRNGDIFPGETSVFELKNDSGDIIGLVLLARDVTERARMEKRLEQKRRALETFIEALPQPALLMKPDGAVILANPATNRILGKNSRTDLSGKNIFEYFPDDVAKTAGEYLTKAVESQSPVRFGNMYQGMYYDNFVHPVTDSSGEVSQIAFLGVNMTELKLSEQEQKKAREFFENEVKKRTADLEEMNAAMRVLFKKNETDRIEMEERIRSNYQNLILPLFTSLKNSLGKESQLKLAESVESNLENMVSKFSKKISEHGTDFTPKEIQIASMIRQGMSNKEIATALNNSVRTVTNYRDRIREKLNIKNTKINLRSYLSNL